MKFARFYVGGAIVLSLAAWLAIHGSGTAQESAKPVEGRPDAGVGTVVMWWGSSDKIPSGWEICDGKAVKTKGATLTGNKPDLVDRFPKGAQASRKSIDDLAQGKGGNHNMPALRIAEIGGLKMSEDGGHTHSPLATASNQSDEVDQADNDEGEGTLIRTKAKSKEAKLLEDEDEGPSEGKHSHSLTGFVGTEGGINADGNDKTGANQPAYSELFFIIRVK